jgi:hypothetical protein
MTIAVAILVPVALLAVFLIFLARSLNGYHEPWRD